MKIISKIIMSTKAGLNLAGIDLIRLENSPKHTLLGLKSIPFHTIIDVGANTGQFARYISQFFPRAKVFCFEPLPPSFSELSKWAITQEGRVFPFNLAIGEQSGEVEMFMHEDHHTSSSLLATTSLNEQYYPFTKKQKRIVVRQSKLDDVLDENGADLFPDLLLKLDVQGYEGRVIAGGRKTFEKASACILEVCLDGLYEGQSTFVELLIMLEELGYYYVGNLDQAYGKDGHCIFLDAVFLRRP